MTPTTPPRGTAQSAPGFTLVELLVATLILLSIAGTMFAMLARVHRVVQTQLDTADTQQRLRVAAEMLRADLLSAVEPVIWRRLDTGLEALSIVRPVTTSAPETSVTYFLKPGTAGAAGQLVVQQDGGPAMPVIDHVAALAFECFGDPETFASGAEQVGLPGEILSDGPWLPDAAAPDRYDADLRRLRRVRITVRLKAAGAGTPAPDQEISFDVAPRNAGGES